ncbi:MAG: flagellar hook-associated protein FlgK [Gallionella sp.]|nr:flagellar hook-associated protein FlgK [Gallionella sp.]
MANLFTSALSGMNTAQLGLATTEHNISNASTPGFTRQQILPVARLGQQTGSGFVGQGVDVQNVTRIYDRYLSAQVLQEQSQATNLTTYYTALKQIDNLLADPAAGASPAIQSFFDAMSAVSNNPESVPARQTLFGNAQFAINRFQAIDQRMTDMANGLNGQITSSVNAANTYAQQIAVLNGSIRRAIATTPTQQPNDLLDQRDQLITKLNQEIKTTQVQQPDGTLSVFVGNGQPLVLDDQAMTLRAVQSPSDPNKMDIAYVRNGQILSMQQSSIQGGNLGAYLTFRDQSLEPARNALGRVALGLATSINQQNQLGQDLNGALGGNLFTTAVPRVIPNANNAVASGTPSVTIADISKLTTSDYQLTFNGAAGYTLLRLSDNTVTNFAAAALVAPGSTVDGITITAPVPVTAGDTFLIRPTANGARDIALATNDPTKIAAAAPMRTAALLRATTGPTNIATVASVAVNTPTNANLSNPVSITFTAPGFYTVSGAVPAVVGAQAYVAPSISYNGWTMQVTGVPAIGDTFNIAANSGTAKISSGTVNPPPPVTLNPAHPTTDLNLQSPVSITFTTPTTFTVAGAVPAVGPQPYVSGQNISYNGWTVQITGTPATGDVFNVTTNTNATGDNRNILLMSSMQTNNLLGGSAATAAGVGTTSFQGAYGQLVGDVGAKTSELSVTSLAQTNMAAQTVAAQQAVSGVNLDEEAANLMRYQKTYQAAAKAMQIANTLFDSVLAIGR